MAHHEVAIITQTQATELSGQTWDVRSYFNPIKDCNNDWVISEQEVHGNTNSNFPWVNSLPLTDWCPPPDPPFPPTE